MTVIEFQHVRKSFGSNHVLNDMNFTIEKGVLTGIIGRNGVGKSTLMKIIAGFIKESSGNLQVFGEHPFNSLKVSANSIFIDDTMSFSEKLNLKDILREAKRFYGTGTPSLQSDSSIISAFIRMPITGIYPKGKRIRLTPSSDRIPLPTHDF